MVRTRARIEPTTSRRLRWDGRTEPLGRPNATIALVKVQQANMTDMVLCGAWPRGHEQPPSSGCAGRWLVDCRFSMVDGVAFCWPCVRLVACVKSDTEFDRRRVCFNGDVRRVDFDDDRHGVLQTTHP